MQRVLVAIAGVLAVSRPLAASALFAAISVTRAEGVVDCPDGAELGRRVERIRQAGIASPGGANAAEVVDVAVEFARTSNEYSAHVRFRGAKVGERSLRDRGSNCEALADAVSVAIALSLDSGFASEERQTGAVVPVRARPAPPRALPPKAPASEVPWRSGLTVESGAAFGFGSALSWSVAGRAQVRHGGTSFELGAHSVLPDTTAAGAARIRTSYVFAETAACHTFGERIAFGPCALFALGRLRGEGVDYGIARSANLVWVAAAGGGVLRGPLFGPVEWALAGTLWVPLRRLTFSVENAGMVWKSSIISGVLAAGLGVPLP